MFAISTLGMMATGGGPRGRSRAVDHRRGAAATTCATSTRCGARCGTAAAEQRVAAEAVHPDPRGVARRRRGRAALGAQPRRRRLRACARRPRRAAARHPPRSPPETGPARGLGAGHRARVAPVPDGAHRGARPAGRAVAAGDGHDLARTRRRPAARALARAVVAQFVLWHSPADARLAVVAAPSVLAEWEWVKWLPHNAHPRLRDGAGPLRMFTPEVDDAAALVGRPSGRRPGGRTCSSSSTGWPTGMGPWAGGPGRHRAAGRGARRAAPDPVGGAPAARPAERRRSGWWTASRRWPDRACPTGCASAQAAALARRLARYRPAGRLRRGRRARRARVARPARPAAGARGDRARCARGGQAAAADRLRVPIGVDERGAPVTAGPQGVRPGRQRAARALHRRHRVRARASCCAPSCSGWPPRTRPRR